jgi:ricin-type beta-trefoil lectin protein/alpha galactosidase A-like protein/alpha galactosidase C-like protein
MRIVEGGRGSGLVWAVVYVALAGAGCGGAQPGGGAQPTVTASSDNGLGRTPAMGWSSWSFIRRDPTEAKIKAQADGLRRLAGHGYVYVNLDDFYMKCDANGPVVDGNGRWVADAARFPSGMRALGDYIHAQGLKLGVYVTPGIPENAVRQNTPIAGTPYHARDIADTSRNENSYNCGHMYYVDYSKPGAQEYINSFANLFASWGADYLKIDGVGSFDLPDVQAWSKALQQSGRPIVLALSNHLSIDAAASWKQLANSWRTQDDVECYCGTGPDGSGFPLTTWNNVALRFDSVAAWQPYAAPGGWNDLDSLEIGNGDRGGLTLDQRRSQLTLWAMAAAPLLLGTDLTQLDPTDLELLGNDRVIAVDQDGVAATRVIAAGDAQVFSKREPSGDYVVALFNAGSSNSLAVSIKWSTVGFSGSAQVSDVWSGASLGTVSGAYGVTLRPGESRLVRVTPASGGGTVATWTNALGGQASGRCLDDPNSSGSDGTQVIIWDCHGAANQRWTYTEGRELQVLGKCLDVASPTGPATAGALVQIFSCHGEANQQWSLNANGTITSVATGLCLDVTGAKTDSGTGLEAWPCNGGGNQSWSRR